jgi:hypothetical protein
MPAAKWSEKAAIKNQDDCFAPKIRQAQFAATEIAQFKVGGRGVK